MKNLQLWNILKFLCQECSFAEEQQIF